MKKINITSLILVIYVIVMAVLGWPGNKPEPDYTQYFVMLGASAVVLVLLRVVQIKRMKMRERWKEENKKKP